MELAHESDERARLSSADLYVLVCLTLFAAFYLRTHIALRNLPMEDALMLLRYSKHVSEGNGISWNIGENPVEGATDFLFMLLIGGFSKLTHIGVILSGKILLAISHIVSVILLYVATRKLFAWPIWASLALSLYLSVDVARTYVTMDFGAPIFALAALAAWYVGLKCVVFGATMRRGIGLGTALLLTGLIRPEGVFMGGFIVLAMFFAVGRSALRAILPACFLVFVLGGAYFLWRWHYFGYLLPNPFYLKGGGHLYAGSLGSSLSNITMMLGPLIPLYFVELSSAAWRRAVAALIPPVCFTLIWVLLSNENNHYMRFQYCAVPVALLSLAYATSSLRQHFRGFHPSVGAQFGIVITMLALSIVYWDRVVGLPANDAGLYDVAIALQAYKDRNYVIAVTEAGTVPYFSDWRAVDLYGLNDPEIVHNPKGLTESYLQQRDPAIFFYHQPAAGNMNDAFAQSLSATTRYIAGHNYELAAAWASSLCDRQVWYVKRGLPETAEFISIIRRSPYILGGQAVPDLRDTPIPVQCSQPTIKVDLAQ